ncbi:hypothetical protein SPI_03847 [Niveomyces insectorum RCEF 264]|uniref:Uncharacterized protein n=1 Tax=Niveomyces insectorum RCEF 264 TaxID=1081102 RepID=A0A167WEJ1_9HYPO|nr:hypothetical protein SPI_03847 [Niveomyces insectorum RCEF 264]
MSTPAETDQRIRAALAPFVRPRDEAAHIRRVLKAHLAASLKSDDALQGSLALVDLTWDVSVPPDARGLQRTYLRALQANLDARRAFEKTRQEATMPTTTTTTTETSSFVAAASRGSSILDEHLTAVRLARKKERLQIVHKYLDELGNKPVAASAGAVFLQPEAIYGEATTRLPSVPKAVLDWLVEKEAEKAAAASAAATTEGSTAIEMETTEGATAIFDLENLVARLEKMLLRAQLLLRREENRLAAAKSRASHAPQTNGAGRAATATAATPQPTAAAKFQALGVARNELIAWMETELGNAATDEGKESDGETTEDDDGEDAESSRLLRQSFLAGGDGGLGDAAGGSSQRKARMADRLTDIRAKYARYVEARAALVHTVGSMTGVGGGGGGSGGKAAEAPGLFANMPRLLPPPLLQTEQSETATATTVMPAATPSAAAASAPSSTVRPDKTTALSHLLLAPYLERLLAVAHEQKAGIAHKAHVNVILAKRLKDTCQLLDHLADESQLLPRHPLPGRAGAGTNALLRKKPALLASGLPRADGPEGPAQRVAAWTYAADSAKIATFEAVAEQVERGQIALEGATQTLAEVDFLLGRRAEDEKDIDEEGEAARDAFGGTKKHEKRSKDTSGDVWTTINGELGLLKAGS